MSESLYYKYSKNLIGDNGDTFIGKRAETLGELLTFTNSRSRNHQVSFIAFVSSFSQNFSSNWNEVEALGRMDKIATFKNTTRQISVAWEIPAEDLQTALENLNRCNALVAMLYPTYTDSGTADAGSYIMSKPPLVRLKYANLITRKDEDSKGLLGYITALSWTPVLEMGSFHGSGNIYPKVISLSVDFTVLHEAIDARKTKGMTGFYGGTLKKTSNFDKGNGNKWPFGGVGKTNNREPYVSPQEQAANDRAADEAAANEDPFGDGPLWPSDSDTAPETD